MRRQANDSTRNTRVGATIATAAEPARPATTDRSVADLLIAIALVVAAGSLRLGSLPHDGLYHDDAWAAAPITMASPSQWLRTSVEHPGFTALLAALGGLVRHQPSLLVLPVFVAGALAPAVIFGFLRALSYRRSIASVLATLVVVAPTAVSLSGHLKTYVVDCSIVAALAVVLVPLANTRWRVGLGCAWVITAVLLGTFSIYVLVATAVAGVILVLHPRGDLRVRLVAVAVQAVVQLGYLAFISGTYSGDALHAFWKASDGYVEVRANPFTTAGNFVDHLRGVFSVYPTDAHHLALVAGVVALAGLAYAARRTRAVSARFLLLLFAVAAGAGILQVWPFGVWQGFSYWGRLTLWLVPAIALGLAEALRQCRRLLGRGSIARTTFDVALYAFAVLVFVASIGKAPPYTVRGGIHRRAPQSRRFACAGTAQRVRLRHRDARARRLPTGCTVDRRQPPRVRRWHGAVRVRTGTGHPRSLGGRAHGVRVCGRPAARNPAARAAGDRRVASGRLPRARTSAFP
jgi:hypothetical protein